MSLPEEVSRSLRRLARGDLSAERVISIFARRERGDDVSVERLIDQAGLGRSEVVRVLKRMEECGAGTFVIGRRGASSRFVGSAPLSEIGNSAIVEPSVDGPDAPQSAADSTDELAFHIFALRVKPLLRLALPVDLTQAEADRLIGFLQALPKS